MEKGRYRYVDPTLEAHRHVATSRSIQTRHVDPPPHAYRYVYMASTGTWMHVQMCTATCKGPTHRIGPVQASGSNPRGVQARVQALYNGKGRAYRHVHRIYIPV